MFLVTICVPADLVPPTTTPDLQWCAKPGSAVPIVKSAEAAALAKWHFNAPLTAIRALQGHIQDITGEMVSPKGVRPRRELPRRSQRRHADADAARRRRVAAAAAHPGRAGAAHAGIRRPGAWRWQRCITRGGSDYCAIDRRHLLRACRHAARLRCASWCASLSSQCTAPWTTLRHV
jgi:hypothetical protein